METVEDWKAACQMGRVVVYDEWVWGIRDRGKMVEMIICAVFDEGNCSKWQKVTVLKNCFVVEG